MILQCTSWHSLHHCLTAVSFGRTFPHLGRSHILQHRIRPMMEFLSCSRRLWKVVPRPAGCGTGRSRSTSTILHWCGTNNIIIIWSSSSPLLLQKTTSLGCLSQLSQKTKRMNMPSAAGKICPAQSHSYAETTCFNSD